MQRERTDWYSVVFVDDIPSRMESKRARRFERVMLKYLTHPLPCSGVALWMPTLCRTWFIKPYTTSVGKQGMLTTLTAVAVAVVEELVNVLDSVVRKDSKAVPRSDPGAHSRNEAQDVRSEFPTSSLVN